MYVGRSSSERGRVVLSAVDRVWAVGLMKETRGIII